MQWGSSSQGHSNLRYQSGYFPLLPPTGEGLLDVCSFLQAPDIRNGGGFRLLTYLLSGTGESTV